ncbi:hypothetical protein CWN29_28240, partial [Klebsiella pneumoniae]
CVFFFFFFKQKTAYDILRCLVGSEIVYKRQEPTQCGREAVSVCAEVVWLQGMFASAVRI